MNDVDRILADVDALHDELFDPVVSMLHVAPGAIGGAADTGLHATRETALDAVRRFQVGDDDAAVAALTAVCDLQYVGDPMVGMPWEGTFKVMAEHPDPPATGGWEWVHWDPNWRQFIGAALAYCVDVHGDRLDDSVERRVVGACAAAVTGEPDGRIAEDYTNPALLDAWLRAWVGRRVNDGALVASGEAKAARLLQRLRAFGDVDEYNSPTYDGVDLWAAALWQALAPTEAFAEGGAAFASAIGGRLSRLYHPGLGAICGPYIRAYGADLRESVALGAIWLLTAGAGRDDVLPATLDADCDHVHDLFFAPMFAALAPWIVPHLPIVPVDEPRRLEQRFGDVRAVHLLTPDAAVGAETGRRPTGAHHQYVPVTAHWREFDHTAHCALQCGLTTAGIDGSFDDDTTVAFRAVAFDNADVVSLTVHASDGARVDGSRITVGNCELEFDDSPSVARNSTGRGERIECRWPRDSVEGRLHLSLH